MSVHKGVNVVVVMDAAPVVYVKLFHPQSGPDRHLRSKAIRVANLARQIAPQRTGYLANSIRVSQNREEKGRYTFGYSVVANAGYARYVHEGTGPSRRGKYPGAMRFYGTNASAGREVFTDDIRHPGTRAQPFLRDALIGMAL